MPVIEAWDATLAPLYRYPAGTWGPDQAGELVAKDGCEWRNL